MTASSESPGFERLPTFLIIGAERCGTTTVARNLASHPSVFVPPRKELHFFDRGVRPLDQYSREFETAPPDAVVGEATPSYLFVPSAIERIRDVIPDARLVVLLRDPVARALSHYWWRRSWQAEEREFREAVTDELRGDTNSFEYLGRGRYFEQLTRLRAIHPSAKVQIHLFEDLRSHPAQVMGEIFRFIGVDGMSVESVPSFRNNPHRVRWRWLWTKTARWRELPIHVRAETDRRPILGRITAAVDRLNAVPIDYPPMSPDVEELLRGFFREDTEALGEHLGRDLRAWLDPR